jgi:hypothetical protein
MRKMKKLTVARFRAWLEAQPNPKDSKDIVPLPQWARMFVARVDKFPGSVTVPQALDALAEATRRKGSRP